MSLARRARWSSWWQGGAVLLLLLGTVSFALARPVAAQDATATTQPSFPTSAVFLNAMTSVGTIDIDLNDDDNRVVEGLDYGKVSDPVELTAPVSNIIVKEPQNLQFDQWLFNTIVPTQAGQSYVITISDALIIPVAVDLSPIRGNIAHARMVHAALQAPPLDLYVNDQVLPLVKNLKYGLATDTGDVQAGTYELKLTQTGTTTVALDVPNTTLDAGQAYTLVIIGKPGSTEQPLTIVTISQAVSS
jgi:Domain of unknown function (DUF4397)